MLGIRHIELGVRSEYSKGQSVIRPEEIVSFAVRDGANSIAIADLDNVCAFPDFAKEAEKYAAKGFKAIYGVCLTCKSAGKDNTFQITLLAKNQAGLKNMYKIISYGYSQRIHRDFLCVDWEYLLENRSDILIGMKCGWDYIFHLIKSCESVKDIIRETEHAYKEADYVEFSPWSQFLHFKNKIDEKQVWDTTGKIISNLQLKNKYPIAVSNANCITDDDRFCLEALHGYYREQDYQPPCYLRSTEEVLDDYFFLGEKAAEDIVLNHPDFISQLIEHIEPRKDGRFGLKLPVAERQLKEVCYQSAHEKYGETLPGIVQERLCDELNKITQSGMASHYLAAVKIANLCNKHGNLYSVMGYAGSSLVLYLSGVTKVNPLPPHYYCSNCKYIEFADQENVRSGFDLVGNQKKTRCPKCGDFLSGDGHRISCTFLMGAEGDKKPNIIFEVQRETVESILAYLEELFGKNRIIAAGQPDYHYSQGFSCIEWYSRKTETPLSREKKRILSSRLRNAFSDWEKAPKLFFVLSENDEIFNYTPIQYQLLPNMNPKPSQIPFSRLLLDHISIRQNSMLSKIKMMELYSGIPSRDIDLNAIDFCRFFKESKNHLGLPFNRAVYKKIISKIPPTKFSDLVKILGFAHGIGPWHENAEQSIESVCAPEEAIAFPEDIMLTLVRHHLSNKEAYEIAQTVRKGLAKSGLTDEQIQKMQFNHVPEWYIESMKKIEYLLSKSYATELLISYCQMIWYKIYHPAAFYAAVLNCDFVPFFDYNILTAGKEKLETELKRFEDEWGKNYEFREQNDDVWAGYQKQAIELAVECYERDHPKLCVNLRYGVE